MDFNWILNYCFANFTETIFLPFEKDGNCVHKLIKPNVSNMKNYINFLILLTVLTACQTKTAKTEVKDAIKISVDSVAKDAVQSPTMYLEDVLQCVDLQGLGKKYGVTNVKKDGVVETGEGAFDATLLYPETEKEVEIYWQDGEKYKKIQDVVVKANMDENGEVKSLKPWESRLGLKLGMTLADIVKYNGKSFIINGLGWDLGGNVVSWEGGKLANKNVNIRFNDYSNNMGGLTENEYNAISGDKIFDVSQPSLKKLNPTVSELSVYLDLEIDKDLEQKMTKQVEKKQKPK